ncbi:uncharacterized protein LOC111365708 [Olea europaea var. sylvestris]|uniref:uncharacterized protein LOC111365708 n=1 Tax=Olea europaea var. sylvestris TaxID=158386 RepID=UPI000C1D00A6|nr:uncharacterized protein LOC111365708 [Olea europaea var. sylvestris]
MPSYVKFMKDILSNKRRLEEYETVALTKECSAILKKKMPPNLKDPGRFTLPCSIRNSMFERALFDLGASINLMSLSIFRKVGLGDVRPTIVSLQLADHSIKHPRGIIEDVLVKVDKFILPTDFLILDMEEDRKIPIILGRPFLATGRVLIDVQRRELRLRYPDTSESYFSIQAINPLVTEVFNQQKELLEACLVSPNLTMVEDPKVKYFEDLGHGTSCLLSSVEKPPTLELKPLPKHLQYVYLGESFTLQLWINPRQVVPKKEGMTVVKNANNELIPTRIVTGWRICMDYRKLNKATQKDHFPLPFIDQILDRLSGHEYYCFLDGFSWYNQIAIAPDDQ